MLQYLQRKSSIDRSVYLQMLLFLLLVDYCSLLNLLCLVRLGSYSVEVIT